MIRMPDRDELETLLSRPTSKRGRTSRRRPDDPTTTRQTGPVDAARDASVTRARGDACVTFSLRPGDVAPLTFSLQAPGSRRRCAR